MTAIDEFTQNQLLKSVDSLPPLSWLDSCKTEDQVEHWKLIRQGFQVTHLGLKEYFSGEKSTLNSELALAQRKYYLALYGIIQLGWQQIEVAAEEAGIKGIPKSPGKGLIKIIELDCAAFFAPCLEYYESSSDSNYRHFLLSKQIREISQENPTKAQETKLRKYLAQLKKMQQPYQELLSLKNFCLAVCKIKSKRDRSLRIEIEGFEKAASDLEGLIGRRLRKAGSYCWNGKGDRLVGTHPGGIYTQLERS